MAPAEAATPLVAAAVDGKEAAVATARLCGGNGEGGGGDGEGGGGVERGGRRSRRGRRPPQPPCSREGVPTVRVAAAVAAAVALVEAAIGRRRRHGRRHQ